MRLQVQEEQSAMHSPLGTQLGTIVHGCLLSEQEMMPAAHLICWLLLDVISCAR